MVDKKNVKDILKVDKPVTLSTIKELLEDEFNQIVVDIGFDRNLLVKDYYITIMLYLLKDVKGIIFKGGTALQKTFLDYSRIS